ncbi:MAG: Gfo/Idh/MocA family oxidoreductase [Planctomycetota bacterium]
MSAALESAVTPPLRAAFIGTGGIAAQHFIALNERDDVQIVGMADLNEKLMHERCEEYGVPQAGCFTDYHAMLDALKPDLVTVCTPNSLHAPNTIASLEAGAHVVVEKPMAMTVAECRAMIAAAEKSDRELCIGFQFRYDPKTQFLLRQREAGFFGDLRFGRVWALRRRGIPNWGVFGRKELQGGGPMIDIGVHALEMCHFTMGSPKPVAATGMTDTYLGNSEASSKVHADWAGWDWETYTVEDLAVGSIRFDNGAVIHIESSFAAHHEHVGTTMDFQVMGTQGGAKWSTSELFNDANGYMMNSQPAYLPKHGWTDYFRKKLGNFIDHLRTGSPMGAPAEHGLMLQQMLEAIYASAERGGQEVLID